MKATEAKSDEDKRIKISISTLKNYYSAGVYRRKSLPTNCVRHRRIFGYENRRRGQIEVLLVQIHRGQRPTLPKRAEDLRVRAGAASVLGSHRQGQLCFPLRDAPA